MAAYQPGVAFSALCCLFLLGSASRITLPSDSNKVSLVLYYESLCPFSANFIVNYLPKLFQDDLISVVDLRLVPWGNAKLKGNDTFECQHGPAECLLNTVEACALDAWPKLNDHFPFIYCVEALVFKSKYFEWESCFEKLGLEAKPVNDCYSSELGKKLDLQYAAETNALEPPHKYVPWVVVDGQPLYEDYENYLSYVCKAYKGAAVPKACGGLTFNRIQDKETIHPVCYREMPASTLSSRTESTIMSWIQKMTTSMQLAQELTGYRDQTVPIPAAAAKVVPDIGIEDQGEMFPDLTSTLFTDSSPFKLLDDQAFRLNDMNRIAELLRTDDREMSDLSTSEGQTDWLAW
ncbi:hypothetical protein HRI_003362700 [Hibiscus trionum]|uniref:Uncharacterized protein n=1 Tax=Hibiscus trionum TaxID=183268 RepID=A0A9W7MG83_HIBTR|nr:hypothetical protein HRI_003362700 [Hibiscus trionum]